MLLLSQCTLPMCTTAQSVTGGSVILITWANKITYTTLLLAMAYVLILIMYVLERIKYFITCYYEI